MIGCASTPAFAGECPADHVRDTPRDLTADVGPVYDGVLAATVDISGWREQGNFMLRLRTVTVPPQGIVPLHSHEDRPGIVYIVSGELVEYNSYCDVPITHREGETTPAFGPGVSHWWSNPSDEPVIAVSTDVVPFEMMDDDNM
ncbi:cupin domain-containing protein [Maricaulaceae bacterium MS644]